MKTRDALRLFSIMRFALAALALAASQGALAVLNGNAVNEFYAHMKPCLSTTIYYGPAEVEVCEYLVDPATMNEIIDVAPVPGTTLRFTVPFSEEFTVDTLNAISWTVTGASCNNGTTHEYCEITVPAAGTDVTIKASVNAVISYQGSNYWVWRSTNTLEFSVPQTPLSSLDGTSHRYNTVTDDELTVVEPLNLDSDPATYPNGHPVVLNVHGNSTGAPPYGNYEQALKDNGFYVINVGVDYDGFRPWMAYDAAAVAVRWVKAHSAHSPNGVAVRNSSLKLDIDPSKVYVTGYSAGGLVATYLSFVERDSSGYAQNYIARLNNAIAQSGLPVVTMAADSLVLQHMNRIYPDYDSEVQGIVTMGTSFDIAAHSSYGYMNSEYLDTTGLEHGIYHFDNGTPIEKSFLDTNELVENRVSVPYNWLNTWASDAWYLVFGESASYSSPDRLTVDGMTGAGIGSPIHQVLSAVTFVDDTLGAPKIPMLFLIGTNDNVVHFESTVMTGRYLKSKQYNVKTVVMPNAGHVGSPANVNPGEVASNFFRVIDHITELNNDADPGNDLDPNDAADFGAATQAVHSTSDSLLFCGAAGLVYDTLLLPAAGYYCDLHGTVTGP